MKKLLLINGPNLNLLGTREPEIYGTTTLEELVGIVQKEATKSGFELISLQSNHEGAIIDFIHEHAPQAAGMIINPGALTHYSYAIRDAISATGIKAIEVHLSNIHEREPFRANSVIAPVCVEQIAGKGVDGYLEALHSFAQEEQDKGK